MNVKNAFAFLKALKKNNKREWFQKRKGVFDDINREFENLVDELRHAMLELHPDFLDLKPKDCMFRIYRDIRFSKDKSPYKTHLSAFIAPGGRKAQKPGYYIHLEPGQSLIAGGWYMPSQDVLARLRNHIAEKGDALEKLVRPLSRQFEIEPFDKLSRVPKGFPADHKHAEWLKLKHYILTRKFTDREVLSSSYKASLVRSMKKLNPFCAYLEKTGG